MPTPLPYLPSYKNIEKLFSGITNAKVPDAFGHKFLTDTLGIKGNGDRPLIPFLRALGFIDGSNKPTGAYTQLKNPALKGKAIANAIKAAYEPLFAADENANRRSPEELRGLVAQVSGADANTLTKIMGILNSLLKLADFTSAKLEVDGEMDDEEVSEIVPIRKLKDVAIDPQGGSHVPFHFNIQVHLPANATEEAYLNIFNAIRKVFK